MARVRRQAAEWAALIDQWRQSGLGLAAFCERHGISRGTMQNWVYKPELKRAVDQARRESRGRAIDPGCVDKHTGCNKGTSKGGERGSDKVFESGRLPFVASLANLLRETHLVRCLAFIATGEICRDHESSRGLALYTSVPQDVRSRGRGEAWSGRTPQLRPATRNPLLGDPPRLACPGVAPGRDD